MRYLVRFYPSGKNYSAMVPDLPGCVAAASTFEATQRLISEAIALHVESLRDQGLRVPDPKTRFQLNADDCDDGEVCSWIDVADVSANERSASRKKSLVGRR